MHGADCLAARTPVQGGAVAPGCAIILGLPATREAFCSVERPSDFVASQFSGPLATSWHGYQDSVAQADALAAAARELGFSVYLQGGLYTLSEATASHGTVVIFGHTRSRAFTDADFCPRGKASNLRAVREQLARPDIPFASVLNRFASIDNAWDDKPGPLRKALNDAIADRSLLHSLPAERQPATGGDVLLEQMLCREIVDAAIGTLIRPGNQLELFGELHDVGAVSHAIDPGFCGEMALITCNSAMLATAIELRFGLEVRLASWEIEVFPKKYYVLVEIGLRRWATEGGSFLDILGGLEDMVEKLGRRSKSYEG